MVAVQRLRRLVPHRKAQLSAQTRRSNAALQMQGWRRLPPGDCSSRAMKGHNWQAFAAASSVLICHTARIREEPETPWSSAPAGFQGYAVTARTAKS